MNFFGRRRNSFEPERPAAPDNMNLTGYDEKYFLPADGTYTAPPSAASQPMQSQPLPGQQSMFGAVEQQKTAERPMVFALKNYSNMYVYEYSDRLEYYRRNNGGYMEMCNVEYKKSV